MSKHDFHWLLLVETHVQYIDTVCKRLIHAYAIGELIQLTKVKPFSRCNFWSFSTADETFSHDTRFSYHKNKYGAVTFHHNE